MTAFEASAYPPVPAHGPCLVAEANHLVANAYAGAFSMLSPAAARAGGRSVREALVGRVTMSLDSALAKGGA